MRTRTPLVSLPGNRTRASASAICATVAVEGNGVHAQRGDSAPFLLLVRLSGTRSSLCEEPLSGDSARGRRCASLFFVCCTASRPLAAPERAGLSRFRGVASDMADLVQLAISVSARCLHRHTRTRNEGHARPTQITHLTSARARPSLAVPISTSLSPLPPASSHHTPPPLPPLRFHSCLVAWAGNGSLYVLQSFKRPE